MTTNRLLIVLAVVLFLVALVLVVLDAGTGRLVEGLTLGGFASFAGAHAT
jgi:hypothetical protein